MGLTRQTWLAQQDRWRRFADWESGRPEAGAGDYSARLAWMAEAWELAARHNPWWTSRDCAEEHWRHLAEIQRRLARARLTS